MINITYIPASEREKLDTDATKKTFNLKSDGLRIKTANFHDWKWSPIGISNTSGVRVTGFTKEAKEYTTSIYVGGSNSQRASIIDELHSYFESDIALVKPGLLVWGDWHIDCYILSSSTYPDNIGHTINDITIYCPISFWYYEKSRTFTEQQGTGSTGFDYPNDYDYDYAGESSGYESWTVNHNIPSDFVLTIYGPCTNPRIMINGHIYQVYVTLTNHEYVIIDSMNCTCYMYSGDTKINVFDYQYKEENVFQKISPGSISLSWNGSFAFNVKLLLQASEPRWSIT